MLLVSPGCFSENTLCTALYICGTLPWKAFAPALTSKIKHAACSYTCYVTLNKCIGFMSLQIGVEKFETTFLGFGKDSASWLALRISRQVIHEAVLAPAAQETEYTWTLKGRSSTSLTAYSRHERKSGSAKRISKQLLSEKN